MDVPKTIVVGSDVYRCKTMSGSYAIGSAMLIIELLSKYPRCIILEGHNAQLLCQFYYQCTLRLDTHLSGPALGQRPSVGVLFWV
jgi:hypothetical protein